MKKVTKYVAEDGSVFDYEHECELHEEKLLFEREFPEINIDKECYKTLRKFFKTDFKKDTHTDFRLPTPAYREGQWEREDMGG